MIHSVRILLIVLSLLLLGPVIATARKSGDRLLRGHHHDNTKHMSSDATTTASIATAAPTRERDLSNVTAWVASPPGDELQDDTAVDIHVGSHSEQAEQEENSNKDTPEDGIVEEDGIVGTVEGPFQEDGIMCSLAGNCYTDAPTSAPTAPTTTTPIATVTAEAAPLDFADSPLWYKAVFWKKGKVLGAPAWYNTVVQVLLCQFADECYDPPQDLAATLPTELSDPYWSSVLCNATGICFNNSTLVPVTTPEPTLSPTAAPSLRPSAAASTAPLDDGKQKLFGPRKDEDTPVRCRFQLFC